MKTPSLSLFHNVRVSIARCKVECGHPLVTLLVHLSLGMTQEVLHDFLASPRGRGDERGRPKVSSDVIHVDPGVDEEQLHHTLMSQL